MDLTAIGTVREICRSTCAWADISRDTKPDLPTRNRSACDLSPGTDRVPMPIHRQIVLHHNVNRAGFALDATHADETVRLVSGLLSLTLLLVRR